MAQLSRPFQIALVVVALFAGIWLFALQRRPTSTSGSGSSAAVSSPTSAASTQAKAATTQSSPGSTAATGQKAAAAPSPVYHGSAPGVAGLTRAIAKAHGAVASSEQNAKQLEGKSARPSSPTAPAASTVASAPATTATSSTSRTASAPTTHKLKSVPSAASHATSPALQRTVEAELERGSVVVLLFWNSKGADDVAVRRALQVLLKANRSPQRQIAVHEATASQVASFGSITRGVNVYGTPTALVIGKSGKTTVLTGLTDAYAIEQAIDEARNP